MKSAPPAPAELPAKKKKMTGAQKSAVFFGTYLCIVGTAIVVAPHATFAFFDQVTVSGPLTPLGSETLYFRFFGAFGCAYVGIFYLAAAFYNLLPLMKVSVYTRCIALPLFHVGIVMSGATTMAWLEAAIPMDLLTGLHMAYCLKKQKKW